jgi:hypothetical protein
MDRQDVAQQMQVEHGLLQHLMQGLRATVAWEVPGADASRKLSTLCFIAQMFQRHLERLLAMEEYDGYMGLVRASCPRLGRATDALRAEHESFRTEARRIAQRLEWLPGTDLAALDQAGADVLALLGQVEAHSGKEMALLQEALEQDEGGGEG